MSGWLQESLSRTRTASTIKFHDLNSLRHSLGVKLLPEEEEDVTLEMMLGAEPEGREPFWGEDTYKLQEKDKHMQYFKKLTKSRDVLWNDATGTQFRKRFSNAEFPVVAKNDLVLSLKRFQSVFSVGAILGVEIKKLLWRGLYQAEVEFYVWADESLFPFIQLITDMENGGVAIYSKGGGDVRLRVLGSMAALRDFVIGIVESLPPDAGKDESDAQIIGEVELPKPSRKRFKSSGWGMGSTGPQPGSSSIDRQMAFWRTIATYNNNVDDVANLQDLRVL